MLHSALRVQVGRHEASGEEGDKRGRSERWRKGRKDHNRALKAGAQRSQ